MNEFSAANPSAYDSRQGTVYAFLSLFLLILAFFIVLVSISTVEDVKSKAVMQSLTSTFTTFRKTGDVISDFTSKQGDVLGGQAFQEKVTGIFATALQVAKVEIVQPGRLMHARMPIEAVFQENTDRLNPNVVAFLDRIVAALGGRPPGVRFDMEFIVGTVPAGDGTFHVTQTLAMARAGGFAREILGRGAPPDSLSVGLVPDAPGQVTMRFYVRSENKGRTENQTQPRAGPQ
ncbi:MAG: flagellar motor protein MotB [Rhodospirillales bacterium]|nr:flagellar motor protein MotB [Alphaproteobacteria bacterium]MBL6947982.1 flagellar motor protein MotB [Rhodospirillales bacterium]